VVSAGVVQAAYGPLWPSGVSSAGVTGQTVDFSYPRPPTPVAVPTPSADRVESNNAAGREGGCICPLTLRGREIVLARREQQGPQWRRAGVIARGLWQPAQSVQLPCPVGYVLTTGAKAACARLVLIHPAVPCAQDSGVLA